MKIGLHTHRWKERGKSRHIDKVMCGKLVARFNFWNYFCPFLSSNSFFFHLHIDSIKYVWMIRRASSYCSINNCKRAKNKRNDYLSETCVAYHRRHWTLYNCTYLYIVHFNQWGVDEEAKRTQFMTYYPTHFI